jgi:hypothetical protein
MRHKERGGNISLWRQNNPKSLPWERFLIYNLYYLYLGKSFQPFPANQSIPGDPTPGPCAGQGNSVYLHYHESTYICKDYPPSFEDVASFMYNVLVPSLDNIVLQDEEDHQNIRYKDIGRIHMVNKKNQEFIRGIEFWKKIIDKELEKQGIEFKEPLEDDSNKVELVKTR